jgi:predicted nucleic-acid-binding protein
MRAVDTNVLVRLITRDDAAQAAAAEVFVAPGAWIPHVVLVEAVWVLTSVYRRRPAAIGTAIQMLLDHTQLTLQDPEAVQAALAHYLARRGLDFSDCLVLEVARRAGHLPLGTFDRDLGKLEDVARL